MIALEMPPPGSPKRLGGFVKKSQLSAGAARIATETTTIASTATASSAASVPSALHDAVDDAPAAQLPLGRSEISARPRHQCAPRSGSKRRTITWATRFVIRPITSRIAARYSSDEVSRPEPAPW